MAAADGALGWIVVERRLRLTRLFSSPRLKVSAIECRPSQSGRGGAECADTHSFAFVRRGGFRVHSGAGDFIADPLSMISFARSDEYAVSHPFGCGDDCIEITLDDDLLDELVHGAGVERSQERLGVRGGAWPLTSRLSFHPNLLARRLELDRASALEAEERSISLISNALGSARGAHQPASAGGAADSKAERAKELLASDPLRDWSLTEVAQAIGVSQFHLARIFRARFGTPLYQHALRTRVAIGLDRVLNGADDLTMLALDLGFSSHSHFSAAFKKCYGFSPSQARASLDA